MPKTRTIVWKGTITEGLFRVETEPLATPPFRPYWMDMGIPELTFTALGFSVRAWIFWDGSPPSTLDFRTRLTLTVPTGFTGSAQVEGTFTTINEGDDDSIDWAGGEITITAEVEEVAVLIPEEFFPATFGPSIAHGPKKTTKWFRERVVLGSDIVIEANVGGASLSVSCEVTSLNQFYLDDPAKGYQASGSAMATAVPLATTVTMENSITFGALSPVDLSCPLSGSAHGHEVGGESVSAVAPAGARSGTIHRTSAATSIWPGRVWKLFTYFRAMEDAYPSNIDLRIDRRSDDLNALVSCPSDGTEADTESQERYTASGAFEDSSYAAGPYVGDMSMSYSPGYTDVDWFITGITQPTSLAVNRHTDFQCGLDADWVLDNNEETEDWRCLPQSDVPADVGSLTHDADYEFDDGTNTTWANVANVTVSNSGGYLVLAVSGGTGSAQRTFDSGHEQDPKFDMQAGTDLKITIQANGANKPFTLELDGKTWEGETGGTPNSDSTVTFDYRGPHNATAETDSVQSRWAIGTEGPYFGVNAAAVIKLSGLEDGVTYKVNSIKLARRASSRVTFGLPTRPWLPSGGGSDYLRHVFGESFKVSLEVPGMYTTEIPSGVIYNWITVQQLFDTIDARPGWSYVNDASAEQLSKFLMYVNGIHSAFWNGVAWVPAVDMDADAGVDLILCEAADVIRWYPYMGEMGGDYDDETPMRVGKVLRGRIGAVVIDPDTHEGAAGVPVTFSGGSSPAESVDTDAEGYARSEGRKFGSGTAQVGESSVSVEVFNRWIAWSGFSEPGEEERDGLTIDFSAGIRFVRGYNVDGTIRLAYATDAGWLNLVEVDTGIEGNIREARWEKRSRQMRLFVVYIDPNNLLWLFSTVDEGNGVEMATQLSTEVTTQATNAIGENKIIYSYWRTDAGAIKGKMLNFAGDLVQPRPEETGLLADGFEVVAADVEDKDIACAVTPGGDGQFYIVLDYYGPSGLTQIVSTDGRSFS